VNTILLVYKTNLLMLSSETFPVCSKKNTMCEQNVELYILKLMIYKINIRP